MTTGELEVLLAKHLPSRAWALMWNVRNSTGYRGNRAADAIAMGLWPSEGLEIHGFELKVSRSDWLRELKQPDKATEIARYCDRWWLVVGDAEIVREGELPTGWGLLVAEAFDPMGDGAMVNRLRVLKQAPLRVCQQPDRGFIAAMVRAAVKSGDEGDAMVAGNDRGAA